MIERLGPQMVSFVANCPLLGGSFIGGYTDSIILVSFTDKNLTKKNVGMVLDDLTDWERLGDKLELRSSRLKEIYQDAFHKGTIRQKTEMIDFWLRSDTEATWEKLCRALEEMDENVLARDIRRYFC